MSSRRIEILDYHQIAETFALELQESSVEKETSIPFIRNPLPDHQLLSPGDLLQVFVIGGTNGESALVRYEGEKKHTLLHHAQFVLPKFETANDFFSFLEAHTAFDVRAISLNFAFTLTPVAGEQGVLDGVMMSGDTKGHAFVGLQKEQVGKRVQEYFRSHGRNIQVAVANDTICLLLSALELSISRGKIIAGIVGTGYNLAMFLGEHTAINLQSSDFRSFSQTDSGKIVDGESTNKGEQLYNKELAGGELYKHFNVYVNLLGLSVSKLSSTEELSDLARSGSGVASDVAQQLLQRSASLFAAHLAGLYMFKGKPAKLVCVMEGSLFWKGFRYKEMVEKALLDLDVPEGGVFFRQIKDSGILGAIELVMS